MGKFSLRCFGVGDGWPCADRNHSSFLYRFGKTSLLIDCGEGLSGRFKAAGLPYDTIDRIFISHLHADHFAGLFMLLQGFWLERRKKLLPVHLPIDGIKPIKELLSAAMLFPELLPFRLRLEALRAGKAVLVGNERVVLGGEKAPNFWYKCGVDYPVRVTPFPTSHLERLRKSFQKKHPQHFAAFCFLIEGQGRRIGHSADLGRPEDLEPLFAKPLDLLVCELAHFRPEALFRYLSKQDLKRILFIHLGRRHWENLPETRRLAAKMLPGIPFTFARDNQQFDF